MALKVFELGGTARFLGYSAPPNAVAGTVGPGAASGWPATLDSSIQYELVEYPAEAFPMAPSAATGKATLISRINAWSGDIVLVGTSQGAIVTSQVYDEIRSGGLASRNADLVAGITFGNPRRQAGKVFPGGLDPGGHGIMSDRLTGTESRWWDFVNPGDPAASTFDDLVGQWQTALFGVIWDEWLGTAASFTASIVAHAVDLLLHADQIPQAISNIISGVFAPGAPHQAYGYRPPISGDSRSSVQIASDHINSLI